MRRLTRFVLAIKLLRTWSKISSLTKEDLEDADYERQISERRQATQAKIASLYKQAINISHCLHSGKHVKPITGVQRT